MLLASTPTTRFSSTAEAEGWRTSTDSRCPIEKLCQLTTALGAAWLITMLEALGR
jgi:hypothetical protein